MNFLKTQFKRGMKYMMGSLGILCLLVVIWISLLWGLHEFHRFWEWLTTLF